MTKIRGGQCRKILELNGNARASPLYPQIKSMMKTLIWEITYWIKSSATPRRTKKIIVSHAGIVVRLKTAKWSHQSTCLTTSPRNTEIESESERQMQTRAQKNTIWNKYWRYTTRDMQRCMLCSSARSKRLIGRLHPNKKGGDWPSGTKHPLTSLRTS